MTPRVSENHLKGRRWISVAFWLLQPESAHPAWQGRAKVPTCSPSQPTPWAVFVVTGTMGNMAHGHLQGRGLQTQVQELSQPCQPWSVPDPTFAGWRGGIPICAKCLARLTKSCLETKSIQSCFPLWANQQRSCG